MKGLSPAKHLTATNGNGKSIKELTDIRGIGTTKKQWLEALGISTVEALTQVTAEALKTQLKESGYTVSLSEIEGWLQQAQALTTLSQVDPKSFLKEISTQSEIASWNTLASFQVDLQTCSTNGTLKQQIVIQNLDTGNTKIWSKVYSNELQQWILNQAGDDFSAEISSDSNLLNAASVVEETGSEKIESKPLSATIEISHIRIHQSEPTKTTIVIDQSNSLAEETLLANAPIDLELALNLVDGTIDQSTPITYHVTCQAKHLASGTLFDLGETHIATQADPVKPCTVHFSEVVLKQPGAYRLIAFAVLTEDPMVTASFKVPGLQVQSSAPANYAIEEIQMSCGI
ncbi:MAG: hypothetical protein NW224_00455 [Leptolyngbyaceae cyanobacterium bins.302]|nr:hypothetical protein [Leptolyngbyaceae cyanobacterium bins.302]